MRYDRGWARGRGAMCALTTGAPAQSFGARSQGGGAETMLWPIRYSLHYLGITVLATFIAAGIQGHGFASRDDSDHQH